MALQSLRQVSTPSEQLGVRLVLTAADFFDVDPDDLFSRRKHGQITAARRCVAHVLMGEAGWSCLRVAKFFGQKHPSILSGRTAANDLLRNDPVFFSGVERVKEEIYNGCGAI